MWQCSVEVLCPAVIDKIPEGGSNKEPYKYGVKSI